MSKPPVLDYGKPRRVSGIGIAALVVGLCSAPAGFAIDVIGTSDTKPRIVMIFGLVICPLAGVAFPLFVGWRLKDSDALQGKALAFWGAIAAICWIVVIVAFVTWLIMSLSTFPH